MQMTRRQALGMLNCATRDNEREIRCEHVFLARKCHPDKWCNDCLLKKEDVEVILKGIANACELLMS